MHLLKPSKWPLLTAVGAFLLTFGAAFAMHNFTFGKILSPLGFIFLLFCVFSWWAEVVQESYIEGHHTLLVERGLRFGMILFIISEVVFFFAFFWAFFHSSLAPTIEIGSIWPPQDIEVLETWKVPLFNTVILLSSGITVSRAHASIIKGDPIAVKELAYTVGLGLFFTCLQAFEYYEANFSLSSGIYGSTFYMATGFHGFHVIIGTVFLIVCLIRLRKGQFTKQRHFGFEAASWYWHFVDVVWLFLFVSIYWWGNSSTYAI
jgi:cytochrome c oxidase subunit 3